jgi:hypothetical protein
MAEEQKQRYLEDTSDALAAIHGISDELLMIELEVLLAISRLDAVRELPELVGVFRRMAIKACERQVRNFIDVRTAGSFAAVRPRHDEFRADSIAASEADGLLGILKCSEAYVRAAMQWLEFLQQKAKSDGMPQDRALGLGDQSAARQSKDIVPEASQAATA